MSILEKGTIKLFFTFSNKLASAIRGFQSRDSDLAVRRTCDAYYARSNRSLEGDKRSIPRKH